MQIVNSPKCLLQGYLKMSLKYRYVRYVDLSVRE